MTDPMRYKPFTRRIRLFLAPPGSARDAWVRAANLQLFKLRQSSWKKIAVRVLPAKLAYKIKEQQRQARLVHLRPWVDQVAGILEKNAGTRQVVVFPPSLDWHTQLFQRPQHLALALAHQGALVFYLQPEIAYKDLGLENPQPGFYLGNIPVDVFSRLPSPWVYLLTWNRSYAEVFRQPRLIYDFVDELEVFAEDRKKLEREHARLLGQAELVLATARSLYEKTTRIRPDVLLCPNGVDYPAFHCDEIALAPPDLEPIRARGRPIVGYTGALATWFDYHLLASLASLRPDLSFVLIGPDYDGTLPPDLLKLPNLAWLGPKPYRQIPAYLHGFDVTLIPFLVNQVTHAVSPIKLFEYMAAGKPVVITPMRESMGYPGVLVGSTPEEFAAKIDEALQLRSSPEYLALIDQVARENTWDARARQILDEIARVEGLAAEERTL